METIEPLPAGRSAVIILRDMKGCEAEEACTLPGISAENQRVLLHRVRGRKPPDDTLPARSGPLQWGRGPTIGRRRRCAVAAGGSGAIPLTQPARCRRHLARDGGRHPWWYRPVVLHCGRDLARMLCERARNEPLGRDEGTPPPTQG